VPNIMTKTKLAITGILIISAALINQSLAQMPGEIPPSQQDTSAEAIKEAFEKAMKNVEQEKQRQKQEITAELKQRFEAAIENWIAQTRRKKNSELDKFVDQNWYKFSKTLNITPIHYDYYLRDYAYLLNSADIIDTDSMDAPYKAVANFSEVIYVELTHAAGISYRHEYFYTVTTPITLYFEYRGGRFTLVNSETGKFVFQKGIPAEVENKILRRQF